VSKYLKKRVVASIVAACAFCTMEINGAIVSAAEINNSSSNVANVETANENGYTFGRVNITGGGYIPAIIFNKSEKDLAYARTDMGGAYRWDPQSKKWIQIMDKFGFKDWNLTGCESIATDPIDTNRLYIAAGTYTTTGEDNGAILRSTDKGETFERINLPFKCGGNDTGRNMGERLNVDPNDNSVIYFGARAGNGLWKSTDYGATWNKVESFTSVGDYHMDYSFDNKAIGVLWQIFDPTSSKEGQPCQTIYVGVANKGKEETIFVTKDGGKTWNPVEGQPTYYWTNTDKFEGNFFPARAALGSNGVLYISYLNMPGPYTSNHGGVWKYNTKTSEWTDITPFKDDDPDVYYWGYSGMTVDASNPDIIMTNSLNIWYPDNNIWRSIDGGKTWSAFYKRDLKDDISRQNYYTLDYSDSPWLDWGKISEYPETQPKIGWNIGDIEIDPFDSNHVVYGTGATVWGTHDVTNLEQGKKVHLKVEAQGIEETAALDLITPPSNEVQLISATGDVGGFVHYDITKSPKMITNPTISNCASLDYAELNPNMVVRCGDIGKVAISKDCGKSWTEAEGKISIGDTGGDYLTSGGNISISADGKTLVYSPNGHAVVYSNDNGNNWIDSVGVPAKAKVISDRVNPKKFYAVSAGVFYVSTDGGVTFEKTVDTLTGTNDISAIPGVEGDIWAAAGDRGMWHSTNSGKTFEKLSNVEASLVLGFGKAAPGKDYMSIYTHSKINGTYGIYRTDDVGKTWIRLNDDNHQWGYAGSAITGDPRIFGRFYLATNGMGIVLGDLAKK
jgi:xyloglucan-specific exo-beta-1,4-glucanase